MSTSRPAKRCRKSEAGLSLVELIIVTFIMGLLAVLVAAPLQMTNQLSKSSVERLVESAESPATMRMFALHFNGAQIARSPLIQCSGNSSALKTESVRPEDGRIRLLPQDPTKTTAPEALRFSIPFASAASMGAIDDKTIDGVAISDLTPFAVNDLVVIANSEDSSTAGLFSITRIDYENSKIFVKDASIPSGSGDCILNAGENSNFASFKMNAAAVRNVTVLRFHIANYEVSGQSILVRIFPQTAPGDFTATFAERFESFDATFQFQKRQELNAVIGSKDFDEVEGTMWATLDLVLLETNQAAARNQKGCGAEFKDNEFERCLDGIVYNRRRVRNTMRFTQASRKELNPQIVTTQVSKQDLFPTCYIKAQELGYALKLPAALATCNQNKVSKLYRISGAVSESSMGGIELGVRVSKRPASNICCINEGELKAIRDPLTPVDPNKINAQTQGFSLRGTPFKLDTALCDLSGSVDLSATLTYFDPGTASMKSVDCHNTIGLVASSDRVYDLPTDDPLTCTKSGNCVFPPVIRDVESGELVNHRFGFECEWNTGRDSNCCTGPNLDPGKTLISFQFKNETHRMLKPNRLRATCK